MSARSTKKINASVGLLSTFRHPLECRLILSRDSASSKATAVKISDQDADTVRNPELSSSSLAGSDIEDLEDTDLDEAEDRFESLRTLVNSCWRSVCDRMFLPTIDIFDHSQTCNL